MPTEKADQFIELAQRYICLRPKLMLPEHIVQFRKKMANLKVKLKPGDHAFLFRVFIMLSQNENPMTMGDLSAKLDLPMSTATRIVDGLVRADLLERINDPNDRRVVRVGMSKNGKSLYEAGMTYNKERVGKLLKNFTDDEQEQLLKLMTKLFESLLGEN